MGVVQSHFWRNENSPCFFPIKSKLESQNPSHIELFHPTKLRGLFLGWALPSTHLNGPHPHLFLRTSAPRETDHVGSNPPPGCWLVANEGLKPTPSITWTTRVKVRIPDTKYLASLQNQLRSNYGDWFRPQKPGVVGPLPNGH